MGDWMTYENCDALIARFFGQAKPDFKSPDGSEALRIASEYLRTKARRRSIIGAEPDDLVQDALRKLFAHIERGNPIEARTTAQYLAFCKLVMKSAVLDHLKKTREPLHHPRRENGAAPALWTEPPSSTEREWVDIRRRALEKLKQLDPRGYQALVLPQTQPMTLEELCQHLQVSKSNLYQICHRARELLLQTVRELMSED